MSDVLHPTPETPEQHPQVSDHDLHELPAGVKIPDDLSGLEGHEAPPERTRGVRWLPWLALVAVVAVAAGMLILANVLGEDGSEQPAEPSTDVVEANRTATLQDLATDNTTNPGPNAGLAPDPTATAAIVATDTVEANRTATLQDLAPIPATDVVEANRTATLQDLAAIPASD